MKENRKSKNFHLNTENGEQSQKILEDDTRSDITIDVDNENIYISESLSMHKDEDNDNFLNCNKENESYKISKDKRNTFIKLINGLNKDENGAFINKKFVKEIYRKRNDLKKLSIKDSYLPYTEWYGLYINDADIDIKVEDEDVDEYEDSHDYEMILIRISELIEPLKFKKLIINEYKLNKELCQLEYGVSPKFKGYSFFNTKAISIFFTQLHCTLEEQFKGKDRNKKYMILELVKKLELLHPQDGKCFLTSTLSPNNILWSKNEFYTIIFTEIFSTVEKNDAVITLENFPISKWYVPEYNKLNESEQFTLSYYSSVQSLGYILFYLLTGSEPLASEEEWNNFFNDNSKINNNEYIIFKNIIKECVNASETNPINFSSLYKKLEKVDESIFEKPVLSNSTSNDSINTQIHSQVQEEMKSSSTELSVQSTITETNNNIIKEQPSETSQLSNKKMFSEITNNNTTNSLSKDQIIDNNINNKSVKTNNDINTNNNKYLDGITFKDINDNIETVICFIHIDIELDSPIDFDIEVYDLYNPTNNKGYELLKYDYNNDNGKRYFSVVPFYKHKDMTSMTYGIRECHGSNRKITLLKPKFNEEINGYEKKIKDKYKSKKLNIYNPICENRLNYLKQISMINPKNYEYPYQYISKLVDIYTINNLVDIILKTGFNAFTEVIMNIIASREYSKTDICKYIENNYAISSNEYKNAPKLIHKLVQKVENTFKLEGKNKKEKKNKIEKERNEFLCDSKFLNSKEDKSNDDDIISITINKLSNEKNIKYLNSTDIDYEKKIIEFNNSLEGQKKKINVIFTSETKKKIKEISVGVLSSIPLIIQGPTSAGKSFISTVCSVIHRGQKPYSTALSKNTTVEDLLGRDILQRKGSSVMSFIPGILLTAYTEGRILIIDECDLAKPEVLSCILRSISEDEMIVNNTIYNKMKGYNVILTMNGESEEFTKNQRNELPSNILSKFVIVKFDKMSKTECESIFNELIPDSDHYKKYVPYFVNLHEKMLNYTQKTVDPIVTLRNLNACTYLSKVNIPVRFAAEIAYTGRFPRNERETFENILNDFGKNKDIDQIIKKDLEKRFEDNNLYYDEPYIKCAYLALAACKAGLHPLLIGKSGSGLTELAKFIASNYSHSMDSFLIEKQRKLEELELIHLGYESSVDDLLGCFQQDKNECQNSYDNVDFSKFITWEDGPILRAGKKGYPVILDNIGSAKAQVIERLNPLLEENSVFNDVVFKLIEKDNKEQINIRKGFVVIGTMELEEGKEMISNALMNRFVPIYLDDFSLDSNKIKEITEKTVKKLTIKVEYNINKSDTLSNNSDSSSCNEKNNNGDFKNNSSDSEEEGEGYDKYNLDSSDENEEEESEEEESEYNLDSSNESEEEESEYNLDSSDEGEEEENEYNLDSSDEGEEDEKKKNNLDSSSDDSEEDINNMDSFDENNINKIMENKLPEWYDINNFSLDDININKIINDISNYLKDINNSHDKFKNIKSLVNTITKLYYIIQRTKMNVSDSYTLLNLDENIYNLDVNDLFSKFLNKDETGDNTFLYDNIRKGNARKMVISLISCDLSSSSIFIQGTHGSGKSTAARHYGKYRKFRNRDPILSISCDSEMSFEQFVGSFSLKNTSFKFFDGPLITAMRKGEPILVDEFNLCSEEVLLNLLPLLKAKVNDYVQLKGVPYKVKIEQGFLFISTGNADNVSGRKKMPKSILNELTIIQASTPSPNDSSWNEYKNEYKNLLDEIINREYQNFNITSDIILKIIEIIKNFTNQDFSLRQIKCLLNRIKRFCNKKLSYLNDEELLKFAMSTNKFMEIPVAYIIISYIVPGLNVKFNKIKQIIREIADITNTDYGELLDFIKSEVIIHQIGKDKNYISKSKVILGTSLKKENYPQPMLQTYFWIRMSCHFDSDISCETLLLEGQTSYKSYVLEKWLESVDGKDSYEEYYVTKNTETQNLIGFSTLDDKEKLSKFIDSLIQKAIRYLTFNGEEIDGGREEKLEIIKDELEIDDKGKIQRKDNNCLEYIYRCINELIKLENNYDKSKGLKTVTSFVLGIVSSACIFGQRLIIKGIDQISPSVLERINSILENPRSLVLTEDTQGIFNNQQILSNLYESNKRSIPISNNCSICFTSREVNNGRMSEGFKSRCTIIICPSYDKNDSNYLGVKLNKLENYKNIAESIITNNTELLKEIIILYEKIYKKYNIPTLSFIRWCNTTKKISENIQNNNYKHIVGIAILRSIFDGKEPNLRNEVIRGLSEYLPEKLYELLVSESKDVIYENPLIIEKENNGDEYVKSLYSNIRLPVTNPNIKKLDDIKWTKLAIDMADAIMTSLASHTLLIFEGPPGVGKTVISMTIFEVLGIDYKRINLSPSTSVEDVFARTIPEVEKGGNIKTKIIEGPLYQVLNNNSDNNFDSKKGFMKGLILDEINLASNELLNQIYTYLISLFYKNVYYSPEGKVYDISSCIGAVATMNDPKLSKARTTIPYTIQNRSHTFKLPNHDAEEIMILAESILEKEDLFKNKENIKRTLICFLSSQKYTKNHSENGEVSLREIIKLKELFNRNPNIPLETLLDLVLCSIMSEENASKFKNENQINNILKNKIPEIRNNKLCFENFIEYDLEKPRRNGKLNKQFTSPQREALMKILVGLNAKRTILLTGDIGTGKTHIIESLAEIIGIKLNVIQFNTETSSSDIIGRLEMGIESKEISDINEIVEILTDLLIKEEWPRITSFIKFRDEETLNFDDMNEFFNKLLKQYPLKNEDTIKQFNLCLDELKKISLLPCTSFEFKKSLLIEAMEKGEWVLLDDVNYAPQEIERLMSLLEDNSSLTIYEQNPPIMYSRNFEEDSDIINNKYKIHENFRLFIITSNESVISAAIKSRCLCVRLKPFSKPQHYAELLSSCLADSDISGSNIISIASHVGKAFYDIKESEKENDFILKNCKLTPVNMVNLSKVLINSSGKCNETLSEAIMFSIFSMIKTEKRKKDQINKFISSLSENFTFDTSTINSIMKDKKYIIGIIEKNIIDYTINENNGKDINKTLNQIFKNLYNRKRIIN